MNVLENLKQLYSATDGSELNRAIASLIDDLEGGSFNSDGLTKFEDLLRNSDADLTKKGALEEIIKTLRSAPSSRAFDPPEDDEPDPPIIKPKRRPK